ncbi:MAG: hypothetical protein WC514_00105 [Candidatus Paceibacterota bacterium]
MEKKSRPVLVVSIILILFSVLFLTKDQISLAATVSGAKLLQLQEQIAKIRIQIEEIKIGIEIKSLKKEIAEKEDLMERVRMYGLTLHQTIPDIILDGLYPFKVAEELATTTATTTEATTTSAEATTTASTTEEVASGATTTEIVTTGGGLGEDTTPVVSEPEPEPEPPPVICNPVASGTRTYSVSTKANPKMTQVVINPLDVAKFSSQTVRVSIQETNEASITEVSGIAFLDNNSFPFSFSLVSGTDINGTWQGSWTNLDTYCNTYMLRITATSASGESSVELAFK